MDIEKSTGVITESHILQSAHLKREVIIDVYLPANVPVLPDLGLLLINDGQDLRKMRQLLQRAGGQGSIGFEYILDECTDITPLLCVAIHCSKDRKNEYGTSGILDYKGRGTKAAAYSDFIFTELIPFIKHRYHLYSFKEKSFCGFSLGALSALDIVWNNPHEFLKVGLFSPSLWWRTVSQDDVLFDEKLHRIMHMKIRDGDYYPWLNFFFETGNMDETADRNNNGIIDSIDDTLSLIEELVLKGYNRDTDIKYIELADGRHDVDTWARAFPEFLKWGWGRKK